MCSSLLKSLFSHHGNVMMSRIEIQERTSGRKVCAVKQTNERGRKGGKKGEEFHFTPLPGRAQRIKWRVNYGEMHGEISPRRRRPVCISRGQRGGTQIKEEEIRGTVG